MFQRWGLGFDGTTARGPFAAMFEPGPAQVGRYLTLLNLGDGASEAVAIAARCVRKGGGLATEIESLLQVPGWREHLVGVVATLVTGADRGRVDCVWALIERGSWAAPQVVAATSLVDPRFDEHAVETLELLAAQIKPLVPEGSSAEAQVLSHSYVAPHVGAAKTAAALVALTGRSRGGRVDRLVSDDVDQSGLIALQWRVDIQAAFVEAGVELQGRPQM